MCAVPYVDYVVLCKAGMFEAMVLNQKQVGRPL